MSGFGTPTCPQEPTQLSFVFSHNVENLLGGTCSASRHCVTMLSSFEVSSTFADGEAKVGEGEDLVNDEGTLNSDLITLKPAFLGTT